MLALLNVLAGLDMIFEASPINLGGCPSLKVLSHKFSALEFLINKHSYHTPEPF